MKYIAPEFATVVVETEDIILASGVVEQPEQPGDGTVVTPDDEL